MKKLLLSMAILLTGVALASAGDRSGAVPRSQNGEPAWTSDYLGVDYGTSSLSSADIRISSGESVFIALLWSSNTATGDNVAIFDSTSTVVATNDEGMNEVYRVFLSTLSFAAVSASHDVRSGLGGKWEPPAPTRFRKGIVIRASVATVRLITVLYNRLVGQ